MKMTKIYFFILFLIAVIISFLLVNYYYGKQYHPCKNINCQESEIFFVDVNPLPYNLVNILENAIRKNGSQLNPKYNNRNAQGKKMNYYELPKDICDFYINNTLKESVSAAIHENVEYADETERYRIFARLYENEDDFLDWHYDNNFTVGNRYTLVIPVLVDSGNTSEFMIQDQKTQEKQTIPIPLGKGVVYNGSITYHSISKQTNGQRRLVMIIPFYTNYKKTYSGYIRQAFRNITDDMITI
jgi:hypothetical protein